MSERVVRVTQGLDQEAFTQIARNDSRTTFSATADAFAGVDEQLRFRVVAFGRVTFVAVTHEDPTNATLEELKLLAAGTLLGNRRGHNPQHAHPGHQRRSSHSQLLCPRTLLMRRNPRT